MNVAYHRLPLLKNLAVFEMNVYNVFEVFAVIGFNFRILTFYTFILIFIKEHFFIFVKKIVNKNKTDRVFIRQNQFE